MKAPNFISLTPSEMTLEIRIDEQMLQLMSILSTGSSVPISTGEMLARWIAMGMHHDCAGTKTESEIQLFVSRNCRIARK